MVRASRKSWISSVLPSGSLPLEGVRIRFRPLRPGCRHTPAPLLPASAQALLAESSTAAAMASCAGAWTRRHATEGQGTRPPARACNRQRRRGGTRRYPGVYAAEVSRDAHRVRTVEETPALRAGPTSTPENPSSTVRSDHVRSVQRALRMLSAFSSDRQALTQGQLIAATGLPKSTAIRLIRTLADAGWLFVRTDELLTIGPGLIPLSRAVNAQWSISEASKLVLEGVVARTRETANIYVRDGLNRVCIAQLQSPQMVRYLIPVGVPAPVWQGASGRVLLAAAPKEVSDSAVRAANLSASERATLDDHLRQTELDGYAVTHGEREVGASSVAVPIADGERRIIAALAISGPTSRFGPERIQELILVALAASQQLSQAVGPLISI